MAAVHQQAAVQGVDDADQLGLEAVVGGFTLQLGGDAAGDRRGLQVGLVPLFGRPFRTICSGGAWGRPFFWRCSRP